MAIVIENRLLFARVIGVEVNNCNRRGGVLYFGASGGRTALCPDSGGGYSGLFR